MWHGKAQNYQSKRLIFKPPSWDCSSVGPCCGIILCLKDSKSIRVNGPPMLCHLIVRPPCECTEECGCKSRQSPNLRRVITSKDAIYVDAMAGLLISSNNKLGFKSLDIATYNFGGKAVQYQMCASSPL